MGEDIGEFIYYSDKAIFTWLQDTLLADWMGSPGVYLGNIFLWTPLFVFAGAMIIQARPSRGGWNVFFALTGAVIAYQAAVLMSAFLHHPPPYYFAAQNGVLLPAFQLEASYSLPDWPMACFTALIGFLSGRFRRYGSPIKGHLTWLIPIFALFRILSGYAFPIDLLTSIVLGFFIGFLVLKVAEGMDSILDQQA